MSVYFYVWLFGWLIWGGVLVRDLTALDICASFAVALLWPIHMPAFILRRLLK